MDQVRADLGTAPLRAREAELVAELDLYRAKLLTRELSAEFVLPLLAGVERQLEDVRGQIAGAHSVTVAKPDDLRRILTEWDSLDLGERRTIASRLYDRITVSRGTPRTCSASSSPSAPGPANVQASPSTGQASP